MDFRHEWKREISYVDMLVLQQRLGTVMKKDEHAQNVKYFIRSPSSTDETAGGDQQIPSMGETGTGTAQGGSQRILLAVTVVVLAEGLIFTFKFKR